MALVLTSKRRWVQSLALVLLTSNFWGLSLGRFCLPILHCEACVFSWLGCPIGLLGTAIAFHEVPWLALGLIAGLGAVAGRFFCGWVCPTGFVQDLLYKIPTPKFRVPRPVTWLKYALLLMSIAVAYVFISRETPLFFCNYCPTAAAEVVIPDMIARHDGSLDVGRVLKFAALGLTLALAVGNRRGFCKVACPVGALVALTNKFALFGLRLNAQTCVHCKVCDAACPMDVPVEASSRTGRKINRAAECIECLDCESVCPVDAIRNNSRLLKP